MSQATAPSPRTNAFKALWNEIDAYWFGFGSPVSLGIFRILLGFANLLNLCLLLVDFDAWFSERGYVPTATNYVKLGPMERHWSLFGHTFNMPFSFPRLNLLELDFDRNATFQITDPRITFALFMLTLLAAITTTLGLWTRASTIILALGVVSIQHRNILILHGGDSVLRLAALYLAIAPSGAACSLDRVIALWKGKAPPQPKLVSLWPQRLIQYNLALIYFTTWWAKMDGSHWRDGSAVWYPSQLNEFKRFWVPEFIHHPVLVPIFTYGTLAIELALGSIVFWKPARGWVLLLGILMHVYIEYSMNIPLFAFSICSWYVCFYNGEEIAGFFHRVAGRLSRWKVVVRTPAPLQPGPSQALQALDPLALVDYEIVTGVQAGVVSSSGKKKPWAAAAARSVGAFPWGLVPGVWPRLVQRASFQSPPKS